jgi:hypothetical protein
MGLGAMSPTASTVGFEASTATELFVGIGELDSSGSSLLHAEIVTANNAAIISTVFCRRETINDSMKSHSASHNGCFVAFVTTARVSNLKNQSALAHGV